MKGILYLHIDSLDGQDVVRFENTIIQWTRTVKTHFSKSVKLFDRNRILVGETIPVDVNKGIYQLRLSQISIEYICITGTMCILSKVTQNDGNKNKILYEIPNSWDDTNIWYSY